LTLTCLQGDKARKSPRPTPRRISPAAGHGSTPDKDANFTPRQFIGQKPDTTQKDGLLTMPMIVPAIGMEPISLILLIFFSQNSLILHNFYKAKKKKRNILLVMKFCVLV
jgi:hypothetical protein